MFPKVIESYIFLSELDMLWQCCATSYGVVVHARARICRLACVRACARACAYTSAVGVGIGYDQCPPYFVLPHDIFL